MAKPRGINQKAKWRAHSIRLARYADMVQSVYDTLNKEVAKLALKAGYDGTEPFRFADYPATKKKIDEIRTQFVSDIRSVIYSGTSEEWRQSNLVQDLLADKALAFYGIRRNGKRARVYYQKNSDALKAFQQRKDNGLNLSHKLWNQSADYKQEMEYALSSAIEKGTSAVKLSKRLSKYLNDYPSLKKDYKEKYGKAVNCNDCEYRSIRLARTEINMAYRTAEQERWKQFDFVLGYEVKLTQNGRHVPDICDDLAGKYPKDFVFKGWHPNCICYVIPVLKTEEQFFNDEDVPEIIEPPENFTKWVDKNKARIAEAEKHGTLPYWYTDNARYVNTTWWKNWRTLDEYDKADYARIQKYKEGLDLNTSILEKMLQTEGIENWRIGNELIRLGSIIDRENDRYRDEREKLLKSIISGGYDRGFVQKVLKKIDSVGSMLSYDVKMSWEQLRSIGEMIDGYDKKLVDVVIPSFKLKSADMDTIANSNDIGRVLDQLNAIVGTARKNHYGFLDFRDHFDNMVTTGKVNDTIRLQFMNMLNRDEGAVWECIDHLNEIANATNLDKIPKRWYRAFNKYMGNIRAWDIETNGYAGVYTQIEGAYNIYKLSTMPEVAKYGLRKVNDKMPWNLFKVFKENGIDYKYLPDATFFSKVDNFVPWYDGIRQNIRGDFNIYGDAYCSYSHGHVAINRAYFDQAKGRCAGNMYEVQNVFYHEYGHAIDGQRGFCNTKRITSTFDKYAAKYDAMSEQDLREKFWDAFLKVAQKKNPGAEEFEIDAATNEKGVALSDVIQSMRKDHVMFNGGHYNDYYLKKDMDGNLIIGKDGQPVQNRTSQLREFIAHMNEVYWYGNDVWKLFDEELYEEVRTLMRVAYRGGKDALNKVK